MDKILTVRQPWASALVHGLKKHEYRPWRIQPGVRVWIHAGRDPGLSPADCVEYLARIDPIAADYMTWAMGSDDRPCPDFEASPLADDMFECASRFREALPMSRVLGWCVFGEAEETPEGSEERKFGRFANPVESFHALAPDEWRVHKGALGLLPYNYGG